VTNPLTIVMYHYVRPLADSRFPAIRGLDVALFDQQLDYLDRHYRLVSMDQVLDALDGLAELPPRAALLTFDDGYSDHVHYVLPRLVRRGWSGAFFAPAAAVLDRQMLDVNKIHFTLASGADPDALVALVDQACRERKAEFGLTELAAYRAKHWVPNNFDPAPVNYFKRMLQVELPEALRAALADQVFARFVCADEAAFADELYLSDAQLRQMVEAGMHIGSHGDRHCWLGHLEAADQDRDLDRSLDLLAAIGMDPAKRTLCYPYGNFNERTLALLPGKRIRAAMTTEINLAEITPANRFTLPRLDTNHLPKDGAAAPCSWTIKAAPHG